MPFTISGDWIPEPLPTGSKKPIKIFKEKRSGSNVTIIKNLSHDSAQLKKLCAQLKKHLGCGGTVKEDCIELQGDQVEAAKKYLHDLKQ